MLAMRVGGRESKGLDAAESVGLGNELGGLDLLGVGLGVYLSGDATFCGCLYPGLAS